MWVSGVLLWTSWPGLHGSEHRNDTESEFPGTRGLPAASAPSALTDPDSYPPDWVTHLAGTHGQLSWEGRLSRNGD